MALDAWSHGPICTVHIISTDEYMQSYLAELPFSETEELIILEKEEHA